MKRVRHWLGYPHVRRPCLARFELRHRLDQRGPSVPLRSEVVIPSATSAPFGGRLAMASTTRGRRSAPTCGVLGAIGSPKAKRTGSPPGKLVEPTCPPACSARQPSVAAHAVEAPAGTRAAIGRRPRPAVADESPRDRQASADHPGSRSRPTNCSGKRRDRGPPGLDSVAVARLRQQAPTRVRPKADTRPASSAACVSMRRKRASPVRPTTSKRIEVLEMVHAIAPRPRARRAVQRREDQAGPDARIGRRHRATDALAAMPRSSAKRRMGMQRLSPPPRGNRATNDPSKGAVSIGSVRAVCSI